MASLIDHGNKKAIAMAERLGKQAKEGQIEQAEDRLPDMNKGPVAMVWEKVQDLYQAFVGKDTPPAIRTLVIGGLLYLVLPLDVVPDAIPVAGLLDDVAVIGFIWNKLAKVARVSAKAVAASLPGEVESRITKAYEKAFDAAKARLDKILRAHRRKALENCAINLGLFLMALLFLAVEGEVAFALASLCILVSSLRTLRSFAKGLPTIWKIGKCWRKTRTVDGTIAEYLRMRYPFIGPLERMKGEMRVLDGIPGLEEMVNMQRAELRDTTVSVSVSLVLAVGVVFALRHLLMATQTDQTIISLLVYPFVKLSDLLYR
jgi:uncharacterized membrane protein YkvA (DUF1232 family)